MQHDGGCFMEEIDADGNNTHVASLWGRVVADIESRWSTERQQGTNHTGEVNGNGGGLMWLYSVLVDEAEAVFVYDSMCASNQNQGKRESKGNKETTKLNE